MSIKVSIIIPVYNVEKYLNACIDSLINQTMNEIEIIGIDDCSTDCSGIILDDYALKDRRVCVLRHDKNKGTCYSRKRGVMAAKGDYILFVDGDDYLEQNACEMLIKEMGKDPVDILQFGSYIHAEAYLEHTRVERSRKNLIPYYGKLFGTDVLKKCFLENQYRFTLWNKMYRAAICKRAFEEIEDGYLIKGEDVYSFFVLAYHARSYRGIPDQFYHYRLGVGITGRKELSLEGLDRYSQNVNSADALNRFMKKHHLHQKYPELLENLRMDFLKDTITKYYDYMTDDDKNKGLRILLKYWTDVELQLWSSNSITIDRISSKK